MNDDTDNKTRVRDQAAIPDQPVVPASQQAPNQQAPTAPPTPVSLPQKEQSPIGSKVKSEISEIIEASEKAPRISTEVKEAGVEEVLDKLPLTDEHKAVGIEHAKESTPVHTQPLGTVQLPMSEDEALKAIKTTKNSDSRHWLAVLIEKIYKQLRLIRVKI